jgi:endonuclease YncB( thermonuclease family)
MNAGLSGSNLRRGQLGQRWRAISIPLTAWLPMFGLLCSLSLRAPADQSAPATTVAPASPTIEEWLNQSVRLRQTTEAMSRPSSEAKPAGEIRVGAEVKAIGLVAGKHWVEIELPDHSQAFIPREAIEYETNPAASGRGVEGKEATMSAAPASPASGSPTTGASPAAPTVAAAGTAGAASGTIRGKVTRVPNAATLVVGDQRIRLAGIDPGPTEDLGPFQEWVLSQGDLVCEPEAQTGRYRCLTAGGVDVGEAAILNGTGRVGDGATPEYRDSETKAREAGRGLWHGL